MRHAYRLIALAALFVCGCAFAHAAVGSDGKVSWQKECAAKCQDSMAITVYGQDNSATTYHMALYSLSPPVGCLCPAPPSKK